MTFLGNAIHARAHTLPPIASPAQERLRIQRSLGKGAQILL